MDFSLPPRAIELRERTQKFIAEQVIPLENDPRQDSHGPHPELRAELVSRARAAGLLTPHASTELGGLGLTHVEKAVVFEEAGYSWFMRRSHHADLDATRCRRYTHHRCA